jgi:hypothetical protein
LVVLVVAAGLAWREVRDAQRVREEQARPFVLIDFETLATIIVGVRGFLGRSDEQAR